MLKRVSIQNFKSLKDVTLDLQKVNLLIGPNNSGKTNFLKALEFCEISFFKDKSGDSERIKAERHKRKADKVNFELTVWQANQQFVFLRGFEFDESGKVLELHQKQFIISDGAIISRSDTGYPDRNFLYELINSIKIYKPDPNKLTQPGPVGIKEEIVNADASNLVGFLDLMLSKYRKTVFSRIEKDLSTCIAEFDEISLDDAEPSEIVKQQFPTNSFKRLGLGNSQQGITYWADELSEGTLYFLALLCIINQPNPPKLLLLEEPEKGIHPRRIEEVVNFILGLADEKDIQVIMTTHSPIIVDMFKDMPESVFIFDKDDEGATGIKNLQKHIIEPENQESERLGIDPPQYLNGLGQAWKVGFIGGVPK